MRFTGLSERGYSLIAVAGSKFDPALLPSHPELAIRKNPHLAASAIRFVQRARVISYIERGILPPCAFRDPSALMDERDEHCIHLVIHRGNCMLGAIRCQFHKRHQSTTCPVPLYREVFRRNALHEDYEKSVEEQLETLEPGFQVHAEISGWLVNPDLKQRSTIGLSTLLSVWALGSVFPGIPNVSVLRASNAAASTLEQFGGVRLKHDGSDMIVHDSYFKGPVQWMATHSRRYQERIEPLVADLAAMLRCGGIHVSDSSSWEKLNVEQRHLEPLTMSGT